MTTAPIEERLNNLFAMSDDRARDLRDEAVSEIKRLRMALSQVQEGPPMTTPPTTSPEVTISPPVPDPRAEPPAEFPTMYVVRYWRWRTGHEYLGCKIGWEAALSMFPHTDHVVDGKTIWTGLGRASQDANRLVAEGCRRVEIITIADTGRSAEK